MSAQELALGAFAAQLRAEFDGAFARAHAPEAPPQLDLLLIGVAERRYALRLSEVSELLVDRKPIIVPSSRTDLRGLIGHRGVVTPVYDLSAQLGYPPGDGARFIALVRAKAPFAVAFERFERFLRVPLAALAPSRADARPEAFVRASVKLEQYPLPVIDLPAIFDSVTRRQSTPERAQERR